MISLDRCDKSCNTFNNLSERICFSNETEEVNLKVFNMITQINESNRSMKNVSCDLRCSFNGEKCNWKQK